MQKPLNKFIKATTKNYQEAFQEFPLEFCWTSFNKNKNCFVGLHSSVKCRDFLGDFLAATLLNITYDIYNFNSKAKKQPKYLTVFTNRDKERKNLLKLIINTIEYDNGIPLTKVVYTEEYIVVLEVPDFWMQSNITLSLYTYLLKVYTWQSEPYPEKWKDLPETEETYKIATEKFLNKLLKNLTKIKYDSIEQQTKSFNFPYGFHESSGFVSYLSSKGAKYAEIKLQLNAL